MGSFYSYLANYVLEFYFSIKFLTMRFSKVGVKFIRNRKVSFFQGGIFPFLKYGETIFAIR